MVRAPSWCDGGIFCGFSFFCVFFFGSRVCVCVCRECKDTTEKQFFFSMLFPPVGVPFVCVSVDVHTSIIYTQLPCVFFSRACACSCAFVCGVSVSHDTNFSVFFFCIAFSLSSSSSRHWTALVALCVCLLLVPPERCPSDCFFLTGALCLSACVVFVCLFLFLSWKPGPHCP